MRDFQIVDQNLRRAMRFFGHATGGGEVGEQAPAQMVYSGLDYGVFNIAFLTERMESRSELGSILKTCARFYGQRGVRWSFWLCEDLLDPSTRRVARDIFADAGLRPISHAPGMKADALAPASRPLPVVECRPVADALTRAAFAEMTAICFDIPFTIARAVYDVESAWDGDYRGFVGLAGGKPVSIVALVRAGGALGVYSLGTVPDRRRHGYGEALLRAALAMEPPPAKPEPLVLESTEAGYPLYRRLGFRDVAKFTVYLTR
jgi:GNAT superfamily N-acetyltransferase